MYKTNTRTPPTHVLKVKQHDDVGKAFGSYYRVGSAWEHPEYPGQFSIRLDPCVVLEGKEPVYINLFPIKKQSEYRTGEYTPISPSDNTEDNRPVPF